MNRIIRVLFLLITIISCKNTHFVQKEEELVEEEVINVPLKLFLNELKMIIETHQWDEFMLKCDEENRQIQIYQTGISEAQYIAEILGIRLSNNNISAEKDIKISDLNNIKTVIFEEELTLVDGYKISGKIKLTDNRILTIHLQIIEKKEKLYLTGGVG